MLAQQGSLHFRMGLRILSSWTHPGGKRIRREVGRAWLVLMVMGFYELKRRMT